MNALLRFLEYVRRELGADDVRGEIGGREPGSDVISGMMPGGIRVVAIFDAPPANIDSLRTKLQALVESFASIQAREDVTPSSAPRAGAGHDLDDALDALAQRARAQGALVIDDSSPVIWGSSLVPHGPEDVEEAIAVSRIASAFGAFGLDVFELLSADAETVRARLMAAGPNDTTALVRDLERLRELDDRVLDRRHIAAMRAIAAVRDAEGKGAPKMPPGLHVMVREFANIYRLVLVFEAGFSELHAEAALIHALPAIERLVTLLPPRDPISGGAKVAVLRRLRRV
jgi:hypothetical protein